MSLLSVITGIFGRIRTYLGQLYTERERRSIAVFLIFGLLVVLYRSGRELYYSQFPERRPAVDRAIQRQQDSLFRALSAVEHQRDSLFFSLPEDSLLPASMRATTEHHSKAEGLALHSIPLNAATKEDLVRLPSVGPASAELILEYRSQRGRFRSLDELMNVRGFGAKRLEKIRRYLRLD